MGDKIWYASYGSNILRERFNIYLDKIKAGTGIDVTIYDERPIIIPHSIYFAKKSDSWQNKGVAYLKTIDSGRAYGWMYLIDKEVFPLIKEKEGKKWYPNEFLLGYDEHGTEIRTLTCNNNSEIVNRNDPCMDYVNIIAKGIQNRYGFDEYFLNYYIGATFKFIDKFDLSDENINRILDEHR